MKASKEIVIEGIIFLAEMINPNHGGKVYRILSYTLVLPELSKMIVYDLFVNEIDVFNLSHNIQYNTQSLEDKQKFSESVDLLLEYSQEISKVGFVTFDEV